MKIRRAASGSRQGGDYRPRRRLAKANRPAPPPISSPIPAGFGMAVIVVAGQRLSGEPAFGDDAGLIAGECDDASREEKPGEEIAGFDRLGERASSGHRHGADAVQRVRAVASDVKEAFQVQDAGGDRERRVALLPDMRVGVTFSVPPSRTGRQLSGATMRSWRKRRSVADVSPIGLSSSVHGRGGSAIAASAVLIFENSAYMPRYSDLAENERNLEVLGRGDGFRLYRPGVRKDSLPLGCFRCRGAAGICADVDWSFRRTLDIRFELERRFAGG